MTNWYRNIADRLDEIQQASKNKILTESPVHTDFFSCGAYRDIVKIRGYPGLTVECLLAPMNGKNDNAYRQQWGAVYYNDMTGAESHMEARDIPEGAYPPGVGFPLGTVGIKQIDYKHELDPELVNSGEDPNYYRPDGTLPPDPEDNPLEIPLRTIEVHAVTFSRIPRSEWIKIKYSEDRPFLPFWSYVSTDSYRMSGTQIIPENNALTTCAIELFKWFKAVVDTGEPYYATLTSPNIYHNFDRRWPFLHNDMTPEELKIYQSIHGRFY